MSVAQINVFFERFYNVFVRFGALNNNGQPLTFVQGDTGPCISFFLKDCNGNTIGSGVSGVNFYIKDACNDNCLNDGNTAVSGVNVSGGEWRYCFPAGGISGVGTYFGDVQITYDTGIQETAPDAVRITVRKNNRCS